MAILTWLWATGCRAADTRKLEDFAPQATPVGITIESLRRPLYLNYLTGRRDNKYDKRSLTSRVYADESGKSLYVFDDDKEPGKSACEDICTALWPPALAAPGAQPVAGWSIVVRKDGGRQWAHAGKALYTSAKDKGPGEGNGDHTDDKWHLAIYSQVEDIATPPGIAIGRRIVGEDSPVFVDFRGMTLYVYDSDTNLRTSACNNTCAKSWQPVPAAQLAKPFGDWSVIARDDGVRQWVYKGKPLYTYKGDLNLGDSNGDTTTGWHVALFATQFIPASVTIGQTIEGWTVLTTSDGKTLYAQDYFRGMRLNPNINASDPLLDPVPEDGRAIGTGGCSGACTAVWIPFKAPAGARSTGYWTVVDRDDGTKQWAYKGFPLYKYASDRRPGDSFGNDVFDYSVHGVDNQSYLALYWRAAAP